MLAEREQRLDELEPRQLNVGAGGIEKLDPLGEDRLLQRPGPRQITELLENEGQIRLGYQGVGMARPEHLRRAAEVVLKEPGGPPIAPPPPSLTPKQRAVVFTVTILGLCFAAASGAEIAALALVTTAVTQLKGILNDHDRRD